MSFFGLLVSRPTQPTPRRITERPRGGVLVVIITRELGTLCLEDRKQLVQAKINEVRLAEQYARFTTIEFSIGDNIKGEFRGFSVNEARDMLRECLTLPHVIGGELKFQTVAMGPITDRVITTIPYVHLAIRR